MNNQNPQMLVPPFFQSNTCNCGRELRNITSQINNINQEIRRLERRILNIERSLVPRPFGSTNPRPMSSSSFDTSTDTYSTDNYMI